jgi:hypothetical protein
VLISLDPPAESGIRRQDLTALATDAARRAWELITGQGDGGLGLSPDADLARLAAERLGGPEFADLAIRTGVDARVLGRLAVAWRSGGAGAVEVLMNAWDPAADQLTEGVEAMAEAGQPGRRYRNRVSAARGEVQLRLGRDGLWYLFWRMGAAWEVRQPPEAEPARFFSVGSAPGPSRRGLRSARGANDLGSGGGKTAR